MKGIADTGFLVAFASPSDTHHRWAADLATRITPPLLTCDAVLAEAAFHLRNARVVLEMIEEGLILPAFVSAQHIAAISWLAKRYEDRAPDFADLCLIRMSELHPRHSVITVDRADFRVYRRNRREAIPLLCPP